MRTTEKWPLSAVYRVLHVAVQPTYEILGLAKLSKTNICKTDAHLSCDLLPLTRECRLHWRARARAHTHTRTHTHPHMFFVWITPECSNNSLWQWSRCLCQEWANQ